MRFFTTRGSSQSSGASLTLKIVEVLKDYRAGMPIDYLADILDRNSSEIVTEVEKLQQHGIVQRDGNNVKLL